MFEASRKPCQGLSGPGGKRWRDKSMSQGHEGTKPCYSSVEALLGWVMKNCGRQLEKTRECGRSPGGGMTVAKTQLIHM